MPVYLELDPETRYAGIEAVSFKIAFIHQDEEDHGKEGCSDIRLQLTVQADEYRAVEKLLTKRGHRAIVAA